MARKTTKPPTETKAIAIANPTDRRAHLTNIGGTWWRCACGAHLQAACLCCEPPRCNACGR